MMTTATTLVLALALAGGCGGAPAARATPAARDPAAERAALWALAPSTAGFAVVITPRGLELAERAIAVLRTVAAATPDAAVDTPLAPLRAALDRVATRAAYGFSPDGGAAVFIGPRGLVLVLPVADRARWLAQVGGTAGPDGDLLGALRCRSRGGRYICAAPGADADPIGAEVAGALVQQLDARGDLEMIQARADTLGFAVAAQLEPGAITVRGWVTVGEDAHARFPAPVAPPRLDEERTTGFLVTSIASIAHVLAALSSLSATELIEGTDGPLQVTSTAGPFDFDARVGIAEPGRARWVVEACDGLLWSMGVDTGKRIGDACRFSVLPSKLALEGLAEGNALRIRTPPRAAPARVAMSALGRELARPGWHATMWGRGAMHGGPTVTALVERMGPGAVARTYGSQLIRETGLGLRIDGQRLHLLAGIRTVFEYPGDIGAKLVEIPAERLVDPATAAHLRRLAAGPGGAMFADDLASGPAGLMISTAGAMLFAASVAPQFLELYRRPVAKP